MIISRDALVRMCMSADLPNLHPTLDAVLCNLLRSDRCRVDASVLVHSHADAMIEEHLCGTTCNNVAML